MPWKQFTELSDPDQRRLRSELDFSPERYEFMVRPTGMLLRRSPGNQLVYRQYLPPAIDDAVRSKGDLVGWRSAPTFHLNQEH